MPRTILSGLVLLLLVATAAGDDLRVGVATIDITPRAGGSMGGYGERFGRGSKGVHDRLEAQVVVLARGEERVAIVSCDTAGMTGKMRARVLDLLPDGTGIRDDNLLLAATHNHAGPGGLTERLIWRPAMGWFDRKLFLATSGRIAKAIRDAASNLEPATLHFGRTTIRGLVRNRRDPAGAVDELLATLEVRGKNGSPRALVVFLAIHPTVLSAENLLISADYPGAMRETLRKRHGADLPVLLLNGPVGDQAPVVPPLPKNRRKDPFARVEAFGGALADAVERCRTQAEALDADRIHSRVARAPLPPSPLGDFVPATALIGVVTVGNLSLLAVPGEMTAAPGIALRTRVEGETGGPALVVGLANDHLGYFADEAAWRDAGYESLLTLYGPETIGALAAAFDRALGIERPPAEETPGGATLETRAGMRVLRMWGGARKRGRAHGRLVKDEIHEMLGDLQTEAERRLADVELPAKARAVIALYPSAKRLLLPLLAARSRALHRYVPEELIEEMKGVAEGAEVPYDAIWVMNVLLTLVEQTDPDTLLRLPGSCTNAVVFGNAAGGGKLLLARNLDWGMTKVLPRRALVTIVEPAEGVPFLSVGWAGLSGTLTALNASGIAITEESVASPKDTDLDGMPIMLLLRHAIQSSRTLDEAVGLVKNASGTCGYHVTIASGDENDARVVEVTGTKAAVRRPRDGVLFGCVDERREAEYGGMLPDPAIASSDRSSDRRYAHLRSEFAANATPIRLSDLYRMFRSEAGGLANDGTLHSVFMVPEERTILVAHGKVPATKGPYRLFDLKKEWTRDAAPTSEPIRIEPMAPKGPSSNYRVDRVWLSTRAPSGVAENDRFPVEHYIPDGVAKGAIIVLPIWKSGNIIVERPVAARLANEGYQAVILPLPYQIRRASPGVSSGAWTVSSDLERTKAALLQSVEDVAMVADWLRSRDDVRHGRIGVLGISLGAHVAAAAYRRDPRFRAGVFVMAGGDPAGMVWSGSRETWRMKQELVERGVTLAELRDYFTPLDPALPEGGRLPFAGFPRHRGILMLNGERDTVIPPANARVLHRSLGEPKQIWYPETHYSLIRRLGEVMDETVRHLEALF